MPLDSLDRSNPDADEAPDPAIQRAERRLRLLEELTEIGMELARALRPGAEPDQDTVGETATRSRCDPAEVYGSLSRAIRLTIALETKTDQALADLRAGLPLAREEQRKAAEKRSQATAERCATARRNLVQTCVIRVIDAEAETPEQWDDLYEALYQRLDDDDAYDDIEARPLRETVERLCGDLCLNPDWSAWTGEGWAEDGPPSRPRFSPFNRPSPRPIDLDADDPPPPTAPLSGYRPVHDLE